MTCSLHTPQMPQPKAIRVNGVTIPRDRIAREVQHHPAAKPIAAWQAAARALVVRELLLQEARRLDIAVEPQTDESGRRETEDEALIRAVAEREIVTPEPDEDACRRYYAQNLKAFRSPTLYEAAHILFAARRDDPASFVRAHSEAEAALAEIKANPGRFEELARACSACPSAAQGGNLGQISAGQTTPEFETALTAMQPGSFCDAPVETRYGLHIIRLDRRIEGRELPFELVADHIAEYLAESVRRRAVAQYIARLVSRAEIIGIEIAGADAHNVH